MATETNQAAGHSLHLPEKLRQQIRFRAEKHFPYEACGLLLGSWQDSQFSVREVMEARNERRVSRRRYRMAPEDFLKAEQRAMELDADVIGIWHSHPDHPAIPSETDRDAAWPGYSYVIVSVRSGRAEEIRSWRIQEGTFIEEGLNP